MVDKVIINAPARLHLGFYNFIEDNTLYGGLGVAIEKPFVEVVVEKSDKLTVENKTGVNVDDVIENVVERLDVRNVKFTIRNIIPRHIGLGSTTQLALALALGTTRLYKLEYNIRELAVLLGRGYVSGIGIGVFERGGLVIDSGRKCEKEELQPVKTPDDLPYVIARYSMPKNWYFIIIVPDNIRGLREEEEQPILRKPRKPSKDTQYKLYSTLLLEFIPSIVRRDIIGFGKALTKIQYITGEYFSNYQENIFCCRESEEIAKLLMTYGSYGVGQSSWGPAIYGLTGSINKAKLLVNKVLRELESKKIKIKYVFITRPRNRGYIIKYY